MAYRISTVMLLSIAAGSTNKMRDEHYIDGSVWQMRDSLDRRFWSTSGGWPNAIGYGVVDDFGNIVRTETRPFGNWPS